MVYIVVLNPLIIGTVPDATGGFLGGGAGPDLAAVAAVTALVAGVMTLVMGIVGRYPFAMAAGLGLNAFVAYQVASQMSWAAAMGLIVIEGLVICLLVVTGFRTAVMNAIPAPLKKAIAAGIGLFLALIGFVDAGFVQAGAGTPLQLGPDGQLGGWPILVFIVGLLLTAVLMARKVTGGILIGIGVATVLAMIIEAIADIGAGGPDNPTGWHLNVPSFAGKEWGLPDLQLLGNFSLGAGISTAGVLTVVVLVFSLLLSDFFDSMGTTIGLASEGRMLDKDDKLPRVGTVLLVDGAGAVAGGAASSSSATIFAESAAGIGEGARTGLASVVTGVLFLITVFLAPLAQLVPSEAAAPALVVVGVLMMAQVKDIKWDDFTTSLPAYLTIVLMPFTYSITTGVGAGFISYVVLQVATGRIRKIHPLLWIVTVLFVLYFAITPIETWLGVVRG
ncbi:NCS2 family permease [Nakamurella sp. YIM 132084]|uniref:NCS2 family permease n=2 Tax=Nakamurella leprariae TaxID=2803911 RepID=A0A938Y9T7_9ACTN|nr:NCS2 family permease [Nakamurella leprariae]